MSERTTIGGTVYESIGSSSSNLLLKCNGTARIQWGSKLIDLIKNGKIASENSSSPMIFSVKNESEIKLDGVYILTNDENTLILICKDKNKYDLTSAKLYIAADTEQLLTVELKKQALFNIGAYYNTYSDLELARVTEGIFYVLDDKTLYTVLNGIIEEYKAKTQTITVDTDKTNGAGNVNTDAVQLVLSVDGLEYLILADNIITANQSIHVHQSALIGSQGADSSQGYRLFIDGGTSILEVDEIRVRNGIPLNDYIVITYSDLCGKISTNSLQPHMWYFIEDFQNHWKLGAENPKNNRPILIRALTTNSFYKEGMLFSDLRVSIQYDHTYKEIIRFEDKVFTTKGRITLMRDENGNEANFDFLDYTDYNDVELALLYDRKNITGKTIFPPQSYNNKLIVYDLNGIELDKEGKLYTKDNGTVILFGDTIDWDGEFHDNTVECRTNFTIKSSCTKFYNNKLEKVGNVTVTVDIYNSNISNLYNTAETAVSTADEIVEEGVEDVLDIYPITGYNSDLNYQNQVISNFVKLENLTNKSFGKIILNTEIVNSTFNGLINSTIDVKIVNSSFGIVTNTTLGDSAKNTFKNFQFKNIYNCHFFNNGVDLLDVLCVFDIHNCTFKYAKPADLDESISYNPALYDPAFAKELTLIINDNKGYFIKVLRKREQTFFRGMIVMHSGLTAIPEGWAMCDGNKYKYLGEEIQTPDLRGKFIKANVFNEETETYICDVSKDLDVDENNQIKLQKEHLPEHNHPHQQHTHTISGTTVDIEHSGDLRFSFTQSTNTVDLTVDKGEAVTTVDGITTTAGEFVTDIQDQSQSNSTYEYITGGNHTHSVTVTDGSISNTTSEEQTQSWENKAIKIEPNYYSLIFIMKL